MAKQSMQDIKRRIKSVSSTERITNSMKLISAGKLRKARKLFEETHENSLFITNAINELFQSSIDIPTKYLENDRKQDRTVYIVVTSSKGLCGGFNTNILKRAQEMIDAKVFTCPQCGGEMYTTDVDATAYCSYCGASNVLQSRVEGIDAPQKIIPFSVTKNQCIETFNKLARGTLYAPREFRGAPGEGKLRPLYVPYRIFNLSLDGNTTIYGKRTELDGAYRCSRAASRSFFGFPTSAGV